ncbi:MAG: nitroreductase family deazaflavin-dependent oxidoreductase, partial [Alphaproteobacteria bacterium]|nr:nitroreductase family deazaflavin-dependent oxidoreductase [Alphaproteobacteria bacterium]
MTQPGRPEMTVPSLLLTTTGRKSGERYVFPLFYGETENGRYIVVASKGGAPQHPGWYRNLLAHPEVEVQVGTAKMKARARTATGA